MKPFPDAHWVYTKPERGVWLPPRSLAPYVVQIVQVARAHPSYVENTRQAFFAQVQGFNGWHRRMYRSADHAVSDPYKCPQCGQTWRLYAYHCTPLWAHAVEYLCRWLAHPIRPHGFWEEPAKWMPEDVWFNRWNAVENLAVLCEPCTTRSQSEVAQEHLARLLKQYAPSLYFSQADAATAFRSLSGGQAEQASLFPRKDTHVGK